MISNDSKQNGVMVFIIFLSFFVGILLGYSWSSKVWKTHCVQKNVAKWEVSPSGQTKFVWIENEK